MYTGRVGKLENPALSLQCKRQQKDVASDKMEQLKDSNSAERSRLIQGTNKIYVDSLRSGAAKLPRVRILIQVAMYRRIRIGPDSDYPSDTVGAKIPRLHQNVVCATHLIGKCNTIVYTYIQQQLHTAFRTSWTRYWRSWH